jgi:hypothetical protein
MGIVNKPAITTNPQAVKALGLLSDKMLGFWSAINVADYTANHGGLPAQIQPSQARCL